MFLEAQCEAPGEIVIDVHATDLPLHAIRAAFLSRLLLLLLLPPGERCARRVSVRRAFAAGNIAGRADSLEKSKLERIVGQIRRR
jgi:hypothetical protein